MDRKIGLGIAFGVALGIAAPGLAQQAVQWRVEDGGNGHWYGVKLAIEEGNRWESSQTASLAAGGHLATLTSADENQWVYALTLTQNAWIGRTGPLLGGVKRPDNSFRWVTDEPWSYASWLPGEPNSGVWEPYLMYLGPQGTQLPGATWNDTDASSPVLRYVIEWSADCNGDGIVDYGQCRDGSLPDYDGDNVPDCCEAGTPCTVANYPVQWRVEDGGNGHWYSVTAARGTWQQDRDYGLAKGGDLATVTTSAESDFLCERLLSRGAWSFEACWMGLELHPDGQFRWVTGEPLLWTNWNPSAPHVPAYSKVWITGPRNPGGANPCWWNDADPTPSIGHIYFGLIEWSADCNGDGVVDYGQILQGQLVDADSTGIPDICEIDPCPGDINESGVVNGIDLAAILAYWGTDGGKFPRTDANDDGTVDANDLAIVLSGWGDCP